MINDTFKGIFIFLYIIITNLILVHTEPEDVAKVLCNITFSRNSSSFKSLINIIVSFNTLLHCQTINPNTVNAYQFKIKDMPLLYTLSFICKSDKQTSNQSSFKYSYFFNLLLVVLRLSIRMRNIFIYMTKSVKRIRYYIIRTNIEQPLYYMFHY